jgi:hypothetical protein
MFYSKGTFWLQGNTTLSTIQIWPYRGHLLKSKQNINFEGENLKEIVTGTNFILLENTKNILLL